MTELLQFIKDFGFPIAMASYLIVVNNKSVTENTKAIVLLTEVIRKLADKPQEPKL